MGCVIACRGGVSPPSDLVRSPPIQVQEMGCVVEIPKRGWLSCMQRRQEERSPVGTQRIISIPERDLSSSMRLEFSPLIDLMTFGRIAQRSSGLCHRLSKMEALITVTPIRGVNYCEA